MEKNLVYIKENYSPRSLGIGGNNLNPVAPMGPRGLE